MSDKISQSADRFVDTDLLIIGSEGAGARAAIEASKSNLRIIVVTKTRFAKGGATITAGADMDVDSRSAKEILGLPGDLRDSPELFFQDILLAGKYLNNQKLIEVQVRDAPIRIKEMIDWGMKVVGLVKNPGHSFPRGVWTTGAEIMRVLKKEVSDSSADVLEEMAVTDLLTRGGKVVGATAIDMKTGEFVILRSKAVILATGGWHKVYPVRTGSNDVCGDGQAIAYRAGAELVDMEMVQFLPTCLVWPVAWKGKGFLYNLIGMAYLLNRQGRRFMSSWDPRRMEEGTRDIVSIAMMSEVVEGRGSVHGGVYFSLNHLPKNIFEEFVENDQRWPGFKYQGMDFSEIMAKLKDGYAVEVAPACHFCMGGIRVNENCETGVQGLYAAGECTGGTNGANRLSGNAITQVLVQGANAGREASEYSRKTSPTEIDFKQLERIRRKLFDPFKRDDGTKPSRIRLQIQQIAHESMNVIRDGLRLKETACMIEKIRKKDLPCVSIVSKSYLYNKEWVETMELENMISVLEISTKSALMRTESRGAHYRTDCPNTDNDKWLKNIVVRQCNGEPDFRLESVVTTKVRPPNGVRPYLQALYG